MVEGWNTVAALHGLRKGAGNISHHSKFIRVMKIRLCQILCAIGSLVSILQADTAGSPFSGDLAAAKESARAAHKDILVDFTGSDWCGWCLVLDKEVFHTSRFNEVAGKDFELVQLDFPHDKSKQSEEVTARNKAWKSELKSSSFPDILLLDETGRVYARTNYREGGVEPFLKRLALLRQRRIQRDSGMAMAAKSEGLEKAKHLDAALSALRSDEVLLNYYRNVINEISTLDPNNEAGLRSKYQDLFKRQVCEREIERLCTGEDGNAVLARLKEYAARQDVPVESRQYALYMAGALACERMLKDKSQALELINQALELAPDSPLAEEKLGEAHMRLQRKIQPTSAGR